MKTAIAVAATLLTAVSLSAFAGEGGPRGERFKKADTNGDGLISKAETAAMPRLAKHFDEIDANRDGQLSPDEMRAHHEKRRGEHWKKVDTNGDGLVSRAEAQSGAPRLFEHFEQIDANRDGQLSRDEIQAAHARHARR